MYSIGAKLTGTSEVNKAGHLLLTGAKKFYSLTIHRKSRYVKRGKGVDIGVKLDI